mgnify:CR=1 FL=1
MRRLSYFLAALLLAYSGQLFSSASKLPKVITHPSGIVFKLCSQQKITKALFFDIVKVGLYYPSCTGKLSVFDNNNKLLRFHYLRKVTGKQFKEGAEEYLTHNLSESEHEKCFDKYQNINASYTDVDEGDYYDLYHLQSIGLDLLLNNKPKAKFQNPFCESLYFNIWFGKKSMSSDFKKLLGH